MLPDVRREDELDPEEPDALHRELGVLGRLLRDPDVDVDLGGRDRHARDGVRRAALAAARRRGGRRRRLALSSLEPGVDRAGLPVDGDLELPSAIILVAFRVPTTHGTPSSRDTMAAWQVIPPSSVTIAAARVIAGTMSGVVIVVTRTSPARSSSISAALSRSRATPPAIPGLAPNPRTSGASWEAESFPGGASSVTGIGGRAARTERPGLRRDRRHGAGLDDVERTVVGAPFDVHRSSIVRFDDPREARETLDPVVRELLPGAVGGRDLLPAVPAVVGPDDPEWTAR